MRLLKSPDQARPFVDAVPGMWPSEGSVAEEVIPLTPIEQKGGKIVHAWACEGDCQPSSIRSNTFTIEWPPRSGRQATFPEVDRAEWFTVDNAAEKINPAQAALLRQLALKLH